MTGGPWRWLGRDGLEPTREGQGPPGIGTELIDADLGRELYEAGLEVWESAGEGFPAEQDADAALRKALDHYEREVEPVWVEPV